MDSIFAKENIFIIEEQLNSKEELFRVIAKEAKALNFVSTEQAAFEGLLERESQSTTGFEDGFAIPHAKTDAVINPKLMVFKTKEIPWDSLDGNPITISHVLLMPKHANNEHIRLLSKVARALIDGDYRTSIKKANKEETYNLVMKKMEM
jgi:fructose-specific phosphotransferase system IIA component